MGLSVPVPVLTSFHWVSPLTLSRLQQSSRTDINYDSGDDDDPTNASTDIFIIIYFRTILCKHKFDMLRFKLVTM